MMGEWDRCSVVDSYQGVGRGTGGGIISVVFYTSFCLFFSDVLGFFFLSD